MAALTRADELAANLAAVERRVGAACVAAGRNRAEVAVVAVSKTWSVEDVRALRDLGVADFGENRDDEARTKAAAVRGVRWHFVGSVQTNKARSVAAYADLVHSCDRPSLVRALSSGATRADRTVPVLIQVSLDGAAGRGGVAPGGVMDLAEVIGGAAGLQLAGVMAIAPLGVDPAGPFGRLASVAREVRARYPDAQIISAGMSADLEAAVAAGANVLRVGTALFGHRVRPLG